MRNMSAQVMTANILIGGEAGQGIVTIGSILSRILVRHGYHIVVTQSYQSRIRGGHNTFEIRASAEPVFASQKTVDLLIALNAETISLEIERLGAKGVVISDTAYGAPCGRCLAVPYKEIAHAQHVNMVALGVAASLLGLSNEISAKTIKDAFGKKDAKVVEENVLAFTRAFKWALDKNFANIELPKISNPEKRLMMNGNDAIVLGALSAGIKFFSFYPMTPSTSIGLTLTANAKRMGIVVEQAEDEIAAINMAIGASFAGAPSMVATSGGGFALMVEGISLSAMTETPIVIVVGQRPAPATGLPTRTEQADLEFVLHSGHGEFPRAIFAPANVEESFFLTRKAFELAEYSQGPVFILSDQYLADTDRAVSPFELEKLLPIHVGADASNVKIPYQRFELTANGISPRLLPGQSKHLVVVDSDEHTEDGHLTEDLGVRKLMVEKRLAKLKLIREQVMAPAYYGDENPDLLFVTWGSTYGAGREAMEHMRDKKKKAALLQFSQVWPIIADHFLEKLENAKRVIAIEGNATAQMARLIRKETGFEIKENILRYDGLPITPEYIIKNVIPA